MRFYAKIICALVVIAITTPGRLVSAQHTHSTPAPPTSTSGKPAAPISMEELHRQGGVPRGWKFTLPAGDAKAGREAFAKFECNKCHEVTPDFPRGERGAGDVGPALTGMGSHHPAEYFAQSIIDPNAVVLAGEGFVGVDGRSVMPDYRDSLTFTELVDLVAYLKSLDSGGHGSHPAAPLREKTAGPYRVRVAYQAGDSGEHAHHGGASRAAGHVMTFVTDATTGESVPYLPISVTLRAGTRPPRTVRLVPMIDDGGFHYGADMTIPPGTTRLTVHIGSTVVKTTGAAAGRFGKPVTVSFDWGE